MKDLLLAANEQEIAATLQDIETHKANALRQFDVLQDRYLGPPGDITALHDEFVKWSAIREETIRMLRAGRTVEAAARIKHGGAGDAQAEAVMGRIRVVDNFARDKAAQFYREATEQKDFLNRQLACRLCRHPGALPDCLLCPAEGNQGPAPATDRRGGATPPGEAGRPQPVCLG